MNRYKVYLTSGSWLAFFADGYKCVQYNDKSNLVFKNSGRVVLNIEKKNILKITLW